MLNLPYSIHIMKGKVDEICIVDSGSTDGTKQYAKAVADRYKNYEWCDDFSAARNASLDLASHDWVLVLDADEHINDPIRDLVESDIEDAFEFTIQAFMQDPRWVKKPYVIYGKSVRLFKNKYRYRGIVHNELNIKKFTPVSRAVTNFQFMERYRIDWKSDQNKKLMDIKIKKQGLNYFNCVHYGDIFRKLWFWKRNIQDAITAVDWFELGLKYEHNWKLQQTINALKAEVENAKFSKKTG